MIAGLLAPNFAEYSASLETSSKYWLRSLSSELAKALSAFDPLAGRVWDLHASGRRKFV